MEILTVQNLVKRFKQLTAVDGVSFSVLEGQCFGLLGPNGAGKTTTIEMMEGIAQPTSGQVLYFGKPANKEVYKEVGIQFQNTALQDFLTVRETLKLFASFYDQPYPLDDLIRLCTLENFIDQDARKLSGGQRQRLLLALALVNDPKVVFLDEPTTGLDPQARRNFWQLIQAIKAKGRTVILTTHYMDEAQYLCDDIAIMDKGQIIERGSPEDLLQRHFDGVKVLLPEANLPENFSPQAHELQGSVRHGVLEILTPKVDATLQQLMAAGLPLAGLQVVSPNLEDLFIKLTGHELRA